jgi:peptide/nickel transport system permease protein
LGSYLKYVAGRFVIFITTIFISITIVFIVPRLVPGDPLYAVLSKLAEMGGSRGSPELVEAYRKLFGLDQPVLTQYLCYLRELIRGNLGYSIANFPVTVVELLMRSLPWTIGLLSVATVISWVIGTFIGALSGWRGKESKISRVLVPLALGLYTIPYYILAIILVFLFAYMWRIFPISGGYTPGFPVKFSLLFVLDVIKHSVLPALSIILISLGWWFLSMRSMIVLLQGEDYILLAQAKGLSGRRIFWRYAFRNALLPQVSGLAISLAHIVGGAIILEKIFAYPGVGWLLYTSITELDFPTIQGGVLVIIIAVAAANFILDLIYPLIDPRIKYKKG